MDYVDLTQAALDALQSSPSSATSSENQAEADKLRSRILGALIRRSRLSAQRSVEDCASFLQVDEQLIEAWELGGSAPSLPQLERLTDYLRSTEAGDGVDSARVDAEYHLIRQRMIGAKLQLARQLQDLAVEEIGRRSGLEADMIQRYEFGQAMIPLNQLSALAHAIRQDLSYFLDSDVIDRDQSQPESEGRTKASADTDLVRFAADNNNKAFIRLAMAFRHISREDLHLIAEALYNIINEKSGANGRSPATQ